MNRAKGSLLVGAAALCSLTLPAYCQPSPQEESQRFVDSSWSAAEEVARTLVLRDFFEAFNGVAAQQRAAAGSIGIVQDPLARAQELIDALKHVSDVSIPEIERGEVQLNRLLDNYLDAVARRYRMSWYAANALIDSRELADGVSAMTERLSARCEVGASPVGEDFLTAPRPALPQLDFGVSTRFSFSYGSNGMRFEGASGSASAGNDNSTRAAIAALATCAATLYCGPWCGAAAGLLVSGVFALADMNGRLEEQSAVARAEGYRLSKRAVASDVNPVVPRAMLGGSWGIADRAADHEYGQDRACGIHRAE